MINNNQQEQRIPGFACPQCGNFITTSIAELLSAAYLQCPYCHLRLNIDHQQSSNALKALAKVEAARLNVEKKSKFNR